VFVHPASINFTVTKYDTQWMVYSELVETSKLFVRQCSSIPVYAVLLFGGTIDVDHINSKVSVDTWATVSAPPEVGVLVRELRTRLDRLLSIKLEQPETDISDTSIVSVALELLQTDGR
jgi:ATP-dependent RNA helicase DHX57